MHQRLTLAAAMTAAGLLAAPSFASAATTCNYDATARRVNVQLANPSFGGTTTITRSLAAGAIQVADNGELPRACMTPDQRTFGTVANTDRIQVKGSPSFESVRVSERNGRFADGAHRPLIALLTGTGNDVFDFEGTGFADAYSVTGSQITPSVDLDNDGDADAVITNAGRINLLGGFGDDRLAAMSVFGQPALLPVTLDGQEGNDTLFAGNGNDLLLGGPGNDFANSIGGGADVVAGLDGFDQAFVDPSDTVSTVEDKIVKVGTLRGSKKTIEATAGAETSLSLAWTHPKAWKDLESIKATLFDGAKAVGAIALTPAGKVAATGKVTATKSTIGHHGKTVTAKLGFKVAKSLKGHTLSVDIAATDKAGRTQTENAARSISLR